mgnify:FL=1
MASVKIEVLRTHTAAGEFVSLVTNHEVVTEKWGESPPDSVMKWIRSYYPTRTSQNCIYSFDSPVHGKGTVAVRMYGALCRERMDEKIQMLEIERVLGRREPGKTPDTMVGRSAIRLQVRNPYLQVLLGVVAVVFGVQMLYSALSFVDTFNRAGLSALGALIALLGCALALYLGVRRFSWWHRARAEVKRRGDTMPSDLRIFD